MSELKLTSVNTIISSDGSLKELIVDDFFDILNKKHGSDYAIYFEKDNNRFKVIFNGVEYYLTLDTITIENYIIGKDNNFTSKLRSIVNKTVKMEKKLADEEEQKVLMALEKDKTTRIRQMIEKAEQGIMPDNDDDKRIYLDYLHDKKGRYFRNFHFDILSSWKKPVVSFKDCLFFSNMIFLLDIFVLLVLFFVNFFVSINHSINNQCSFSFYWPISAEILCTFFVTIVPFCQYPFIFVDFLFRLIGKRVSRLLHYRENKKLRNYKIIELTHQLSLSNVKDNVIKFFDRTLGEEEKVEHIIPMDDYVMKYLGEIAVRLKYINTDDSGKLLSEVERLAVEYKQRIENVRTKELNEAHTSIKLEIAPETERSIKVDILVRAGHICDKMLQIRGYDVEKLKLNDDFNTLMKIINSVEKVVGDKIIRGRKPGL